MGGLRARAGQLVDDLTRVIDEATALGRLRAAALRLQMPLVQVTGEPLEHGLHGLIAAMAAAGVDWDEAERRILAGPTKTGT